MRRRISCILVIVALALSACGINDNTDSKSEPANTTAALPTEPLTTAAGPVPAGYEKTMYAHSGQDMTIVVTLYLASGQPVHMKYLQFESVKPTARLEGCNAAISGWGASEGQFAVDAAYPSTFDTFSGTLKLENGALRLLSGDMELTLEASHTPPRDALPFSPIEAEVAGFPFGTQLSADLTQFLGEELSREPYTMYETDKLAKIEYENIIIDGFLADDGSLTSIKGFKVTGGEIETIRGIAIGDSLDYVLGRFPGGSWQSERFLHDTYGDIKMLYGTAQHMQDYGYISYENNAARRVIYSGGGSMFIVELDQALRVASIEYIW